MSAECRQNMATVPDRSLRGATVLRWEIDREIAPVRPVRWRDSNCASALLVGRRHMQCQARHSAKPGGRSIPPSNRASVLYDSSNTVAVGTTARSLGLRRTSPAGAELTTPRTDGPAQEAIPFASLTARLRAITQAGPRAVSAGAGMPCHRKQQRPG